MEPYPVTFPTMFISLTLTSEEKFREIGVAASMLICPGIYWRDGSEMLHLLVFYKWVQYIRKALPSHCPS